MSVGDRDTVRSLDLIRDEPATVDAAIQLLADPAATADQRWAAVYVLANATDRADALVPVLDDPDPTLRTLAAIGAVGQGDSAGLRVLVAALTDETFAYGIEPAAQLWELATNALVRSTGLTLGPAFDADPADRAAAQARWTAWLDEHEAALTFDPTTEEWS